MTLFSRITCQPATKEPIDSSGWSIEGKSINLDLSRISELSDPGNAVRLERPDIETRVLVVHGIDGQFYAYKNNCACGGFRIDPVPKEEKIKCCTLGQSTYDYNGNPLSGPADKNLTLFPVERTGDFLIIKLEN